MYLTSDLIREVELKYGSPDVLAFAYEMRPNEFDMVRRSQKFGRAHDVTLFILCNNRIAVIKKPMYPPGAYRAPSGGIAPGEPFEQGAVREALEETGLEIVLQRYLIRARVRFTCGPLAIAWTTHVLSATPGLEVSQDDPVAILQPRDTHEIVEARFAELNEITGDIREALIRSKSTGLKYRADLTDAVLRKMAAEGLIQERE